MSSSNWYVSLHPSAVSATGRSTSPPVVSEEQTCLETYFQCLGNFAYDKAKEIVDKYRDGKKSVQGLWSQMMTCLSGLAAAEKIYISLSFLNSGISLFGQKRDTTLRTSYENLSREFRRMGETTSIDSTLSSTLSSTPSSTPSGAMSSMDKLLVHLAAQMQDFITARLKMMNFYDQMATMGTMKYISFEDLKMVVTDIIQTSHKSFHHPILSPLKTAFSLECEISCLLVDSQVHMSTWQFLPSLLYLHEAHTKLSLWNHESCQPKETKMLGFGSRQPAEPVLYACLSKMKSLLVAKFSLYFYETLSSQTPAASTEMKSLTAKCPVDFYGRIVAFQKKTDAMNISLVFDVEASQESYQGPGYHHPQSFTERPKGLNSFPAIFSFPNEKPTVKWPNVIMLISSSQSEHSMDKLIYFYDKKTDSTYYLSRIETQITFVVIFESKKAEKDSYIHNFVTDISASLRLTKLLQSLKTGTK